MGDVCVLPWLCAVGGVADVCVWQLSSRRLLRVLRHHTQGVHLLSFSPDGAYLVAVAGNSLCLWGLDVGEPVALGRTSEVSTGWAEQLRA